MLGESTTALKELFSLKTQLDRIDLQCKNSDMTYSLNYDSNFEDRNAFCTGLSRFIEETTVLNSLHKVIEEGLTIHAPMLYSWRGLSQTFPIINDDDPNKEKAYKAILKVLTTQTESIFHLYDFIRNNARVVFLQEFTRYTRFASNNDSISEGVLYTLGQLIFMFFQLNHLTNVKTSLKNDFSAFKRYSQLTKNNESGSDSSIALIQEITLFLASKDQIISDIKSDIIKIPSYQDLLFAIYNNCCTILEEKLYLLPKSKYDCIGTICAIIFLLHQPNKSISKLDKKKFSLSRAEKVFKEYPLVSFIGDLEFNISTFLQKLGLNDSFNMLNDVITNVKSFETKFSLVSLQSQLRDPHFMIVSQLTQMKSKLITSGGQNAQDLNWNMSLKMTWDSEETNEYFNIFKKAFLHLSELSLALNLAICWKMSNPPRIEKLLDGTSKIVRIVDSEKLNTDIKDANDIDVYELLTKYNYNVNEKNAFVIIITYMKSLYNILKEMETVALQIIAAKTYNMMQDLIQNKLSETIVKVNKNNKSGVLKLLINSLRDTCCDQNSLNASTGNLGSYSNKKKSNQSSFNKTTIPLSTRLYMFYNILGGIASSKEYRKDIDSHSLASINEILNSRFIFTGLINFGETLKECTDLSYLWFREFFLEMSTSRKVQFPIDCSIPWILINHIIESADPSQTSNLLFLLDIYNDSAEFALKKLKRRYMYDELEAEVNLIFEQLVYNLAEKIYIYYRSYAATIYANKGYRTCISQFLRQHDKINIPEAQLSLQTAHRYWVYFRQSTIQVLGRDVDLAKLLSQRLILSLRKSLSSAMLVLEASSITNIHDFDALIQVTRLTHGLLSAHLSNLPNFDILFDEANNSVNGKSMSRITLHVLWDLINDFIVGFAYCSLSNKFVRGTVHYGPPVTRPSSPSVAAVHLFGNKSLSMLITTYNQPTRSYVGQNHWILLIKYVGYHGIAVIIEQMTRYVSVLLNEKLAPYVDVLRQGMPSKVSLPRVNYGFIGNIRYYSANFDNIFKYKDLYPCVFQTMREIGNSLIVIYCLENALKHFESYQVTFDAPYIGVIPSDNLDFSNVFSTDPFTIYNDSQPDNIKNILKQVHILSSEKLSFGLSIFNYLLYNIKSILTGDTWVPPVPLNAAIAVDNCVEFHRIFSVLCVAMAQTFSTSNSTPEQIFGDGIIWCGVTISTMLGMSQRSEGLDFVNHAIEVSENESIREQLGLSTTTQLSKPLSKKINAADENTNDILFRMKSISIRRRNVQCILSSFYNSPYFDNIEKIRCFGVPKFTPPSS